jgi:micrococcal nuclease
MKKFNISVQLYTYKAIITDVYDGDTFTADIDLGLGIWKKGVKLRLAHVDTPEIRGSEKVEGKKVRDHVRELILDKNITLQTFKDKTGKFGRLIAEVYLDQDKTLSDYLIENNMAEWYAY